jgi:hypothetical protein
LIAAMPDRVVTGAAMVVFGLAVSLFNVIGMSMRPSAVPEAMLGRVLSVRRMFCWGGLPVGALLAGAVATTAGLRWAVTAAAGAVILVWLITLRPMLASDPHEYVIGEPADAR